MNTVWLKKAKSHGKASHSRRVEYSAEVFISEMSFWGLKEMHLTQSFACKSQGPIDPVPELCVPGCWFGFTPRGRQFWSSRSPWTGSLRSPQWLLLSTPFRKISPPRTVAFLGGLQPVVAVHKDLGGHTGKVAQQWGVWETRTHLCASCCGWFVLKRTDISQNGKQR